jgi:benzoate membrane transport protein
MREALRPRWSGQALAAGVSASLLGYGSSIAVVVAGLTAVGADTRQTSSALLVLGTVVAVVTIVASARLRMPISIVWSTSGMALLAGLGTIRGGFAGAVAGLVLCGLLIGLTGLLPPLGAALARIPAPLNAAGPGAHPDPAMRWIAAVAAGATMLVLASVAPLAASVMTQADPLLIGTAAGLALLGAFVGALGDALRNEALRVPAGVTVLVTASGVTAFGVGSAPLGLLAGGIVLGMTRFGRLA